MARKPGFHEKVLERIEFYSPKGGLDTTSRFFLHMASVRHMEVRNHCERLALLAEAVAGHKSMKKDQKATFFGGLLHDVAKIILPAELFDGRNINAEQYALVKEHAYDGYNILKGLHLFTSLVGGAHHAMYRNGYGITAKDFPQDWGIDTIKKVLDIAAIVSVCDFIDAFTHRNTEIKDGSGAAGQDLKTMLVAKYPNDIPIIEVALILNSKMKL